MLTVAKINGRQAAGYADYLEGKTTTGELGDYYLKDGDRVEAPGRWVRGTQHVGADPAAVVTGEQLRDLMAVRYPGTERPLRRVGGNGEAVAALDATFSAPKSVSAIWALANQGLRHEIEAMHEAAINRALDYSLRYVAITRERISSMTVIHAKAADVIATSWRHTTARAVADQLPDPQLHSHVLLHAAVRADGQLVAIDSRAWLVHRREVAAAYRTELARGMAELGFEVQRGTGRGGRYFEIAGVPQELMDRWSSRSHQIQEAIDANLEQKRHRLQERVDAGGPDGELAQAQLTRLTESPRLSPAEDRMLRVSTRTSKNSALTNADLDEGWRVAAAELGITSELTALRSADGTRLAPLAHEEMLAALTEFDATFLARDARAAALEQSAGAPYPDTLAALRVLWTDGQVLALADGTQTTASHRDMEFEVISTAERLIENDIDPIEARHVTDAARVVNEQLEGGDGKLSEEQQAALGLASASQQVVMIEGQAGTGKSTVLQAVALAHQAAGRQVIVTSTAGVAAQRLADDLTTAGVSATPYSTVALMHAIDAGRLELDPETTLIHDEAALASTREQHQLFSAVEQAGSRLILVGDPQQSKPVGASGLWRGIEAAARENDARIELTINLRAQDPADRDAQKQFRDGNHLQAITDYADRGRVHLHADLIDAEDAALERAQEDRREGKRTIVIAQTSNDHLDELNARAQALRKQDGQLGPDSLAVPGRLYKLRAEDEVQVRRNLTHPEHGKLCNGSTATITAIDPKGHTATLKLASGEQVELDRAQMHAADLRLAYVQHPFPAQGSTADTAHLIVGEHVSREGAYVAITRAREHAHIYAGEDTIDHDPEAPPLAQLAQMLSREEPDLPSIAQPLKAQIETRAETARPEPAWRRALGEAPDDPDDRRRWTQTVSAIVAYRSTYGITDEDREPLGAAPPAGAFGQRLERGWLATRLGAFSGARGDVEADRVQSTQRRDADAGWEP